MKNSSLTAIQWYQVNMFYYDSVSYTHLQVSHLYRITQEILSNSLKHGKASTIKVIMNFTDSEFIISFSDDGIGTDKIVESGVGLKSIKERAEEIEAIVDMKSARGKGFFVRIIVPKEVEV